MERFQLLCVVNILLIKDKKILLMRRMNTGYRDGDYEVPAGHIDGGEPVTIAAIREAKEEIGVNIKKEDLRVVHVMHRYGEKHERIEFFLIADKWEGEPTITEPDKCDDLQWFSLGDLPENTIPKARHGIEQYKLGVIFSEFDWSLSEK